MEIIKSCQVYPTVKCNCTGACRIERSEIEEQQRQQQEADTVHRRLQDLIDFQLFLFDKGYIDAQDWDFTDEAEEYLKLNS
jgi:ABC-type enterochelin transport system ATPase subunit